MPKTSATGEVFFFNDTATTEIYTLSLHDALPIFIHRSSVEKVLSYNELARKEGGQVLLDGGRLTRGEHAVGCNTRTEEHTSELQPPLNLVCRLLLAKKKPKSGSFRPDSPTNSQES